MTHLCQLACHAVNDLDKLFIYLGHGASGSAATMRPYVDGLGRRGFRASAVSLPRGRAERAVEPYRAQIGQSMVDVIIGGQSFGGRVASLIAAQEPPRGLVLLSYPLHRPGRPDDLRTAHWPAIRCPVLLLSGEADPFARIDLLREAVRLLPDAELHTYPRLGHGVAREMDDALDRLATFARRVSAAGS